MARSPRAGRVAGRQREARSRVVSRQIQTLHVDNVLDRLGRNLLCRGKRPVGKDFSEAINVAEKYPDKLEELKKLWWSEAEKYGSLPLP